MLKQLTFETGGSWETTQVLDREVPINVRAIEIKYNRLTEETYEFNQRLIIPQPFCQEKIDNLIAEGLYDDCYQYTIDDSCFPGSMTFAFGENSTLTIMSNNVEGTDGLRVIFDGIELTSFLTKININISSIENLVEANFSYIISGEETTVHLYNI